MLLHTQYLIELLVVSNSPADLLLLDFLVAVRKGVILVESLVVVLVESVVLLAYHFRKRDCL